LAERYGVSPVSAAGWNKLAINSSLKLGQRVTLMLPKPVATAARSKRSVSSARATASSKARPVARARSTKSNSQKGAAASKKSSAVAAKKAPTQVASQKP
jgi:membrane-bound lytic murein transglycosylase D